MKLEKNIFSFGNDTKELGGYVYTRDNKLSSKMANGHITKLTLSMVNIRNTVVFDIGCGDGTYTQEWYKFGKPKSIYAIDPSSDAIKSAIKNNKYKKNIKYEVGNIYKLPRIKFDIAIVRGVLHHLYKPENAMAEISKVAKKIIIVEPNGYNPLLKIIERVSVYHREHEEKSYFPFSLNRWIVKNGGTIISSKYGGLVPFFCPEFIAVILKKIEPIVERLPLLRNVLCANYYVVYENK